MITATPDGRRLRIHVEQDPEDIAAGSVIDDFLVDPLPAKRGMYLSRQFVQVSLGTIPDVAVEPADPAAMESLLIESLGAANYERLAGCIVVPVDDEDHRARGVRFVEFEEHDGRVATDGEPLRQEEVRQVMLAAFYWQSVLGIEGVRAFLETPESSGGKVLGLLLVALGVQLSRTSRGSASEPQTQQAVTPATNTPTGTSASVMLPPVSSAGNSPKTPTDHLRSGARQRRSFGRG